jgi:coenzyme F420-dependent glucose-6-phosphate dehydrogenase
MMDEALDLIRRLWNGETVDGNGGHFSTKQAKLHTPPTEPPPLYVSAFHPGAAEVAAKHADGIWCLGDPEIAPDVIDAYEKAGGKGEIILQALVSWAPDDDAALEGARTWKGAQPPEYYVDDWHDPQAMYEHAEETISDDEYREKAILSSDPGEHAKRLGELKEMGATVIVVQNCSGAAIEESIRVYGEQVLPQLRA